MWRQSEGLIHRQMKAPDLRCVSFQSHPVSGTTGGLVRAKTALMIHFMVQSLHPLNPKEVGSFNFRIVVPILLDTCEVIHYCSAQLQYFPKSSPNLAINQKNLGPLGTSS